MKQLIGVLVVAMFVLSSCAHKGACAMDGDKGRHHSEKSMEMKHASKDMDMSKEHSAKKMHMAKDHVCSEACDHSAEGMAKDHVCGGVCEGGEDCKMHAKHGEEGHVCSEECAAMDADEGHDDGEEKE